MDESNWGGRGLCGKGYFSFVTTVLVAAFAAGCSDGDGPSRGRDAAPVSDAAGDVPGDAAAGSGGAPGTAGAGGGGAGGGAAGSGGGGAAGGGVGEGGAGGGASGTGGSAGAGAGGASGGGTGGTAATPDAGAADQAAGPDAPVDMAAPSPQHACVDLPRPRDSYRLVEPFPQLPAFDGPTVAVQAPGQPDHWYVAEQTGRFKRFANRADASAATVVLDLSDRVEAAGDSGLLAVAFHPKFTTNGEVFLGYVQKGSPTKSRLSRFKTTDGGASFNPASEEILIELDQPDPEKVHYNCDMHFGTDGFLWVGFGDGGFEDDSRNEAQNLNTLNGKILRIDVDRRGPANEPYAIPADNPFVGRAGTRAEIWAYGFRNPWRWRFDPRADGVLWVGDVGADEREELSRVVKGGNYGWRVREGTFCKTPPCEVPDLLPPVVEYTHTEGKSVTAGPVYRGQEIPSLHNRVIYADFFFGQIWALPPDNSPQPELLVETGLAIASFAEPLDGSIIAIDFDGGRLHKVTAPAASGPDTFPQLLSQTGCYQPGGTPAAALVPYDVNAPLWSDGAAKRRWMALPPGGKITVGADGDFDFPPKTTLVKEFAVGQTRVETRLFVRHADGGWAGYTYAWNAEQTEATLVPPSSRPMTKTFGAVTWSYPTRGQCMTCHTKQAGFTLGPEVAQLNRTFDFATGARNQLEHFSQAGLFAAPLPAAPASLPALPAPDGTAALAARARSYLHGNCAGCHRPNMRFTVGMDLRSTIALRDTGTCNVDSGFGGFAGATKRLVPGQPSASILTRSMRATGAQPRMPLVGTNVIDEQGAALVEAWITSLASCD